MADDEGEEGDAALWRAATRDTRQLPRRPPPPGLSPPPRRWAVREIVAEVGTRFRPSTGPAGHGLDRRTDERLRRGELPIEARLDLHFMNQSQAQAALHDFIIRSAARGHRCVLIITGRGTATARGDDKDWTTAPPGILRDRLPEWLRGGELGPFILKYYPAQRRHGGDGAFYVLLRRQR